MAANTDPGPALIRLADTDRTIPAPDEDVRGRKVIDKHGDELGKITDLLVDDDATHVRLLVIEDGGILGIGAKESYLPVEAITEIQPDEVFVDTDVRTVAGAPQYDPAIDVKAKYYERVYGHYGYKPSWTDVPSNGTPYRNPGI